MINMVFIYYDNPKMLGFQLHHWNSYIGVLDPMPTIILIDDCSPTTHAEEVLKMNKCDCPLKLYRIDKDIQWNISGARNLGCSVSDHWIYMSDIDTVIPADDAKRLFNQQTLQMECVYMPRRVQHETESVMRPAIVNLMFHKSAFMEIGGYDEDYAGHYGREETDFWNRMRRAKRMVARQDVTIRVISPGTVRDANTRGISRDYSRNHLLYDQKLAKGFLKPARPLRFPWHQVI